MNLALSNLKKKKKGLTCHKTKKKYNMSQILLCCMKYLSFTEQIVEEDRGTHLLGEAKLFWIHEAF